jgi:hypothetical protein
MQSNQPFQKSRDKLLEMADRAAAKPESMTRSETNYTLAKTPDGDTSGAPNATPPGADWASGDSREAQALRADMQKSGLEANAGAVRQDTGGWSYRDIGGGRIKIVSAPPGSKAAGKILDPSKIATLPEADRIRAERAYASITRVMSGGEPLAPYQPSPGKKTPPERDMLGGERNAPVASSGRAPDPAAGVGTPGFANAVIPTGRGPAINQGDAPGPGAIDTATAPPARSFKSAPYRR